MNANPEKKSYQREVDLTYYNNDDLQSLQRLGLSLLPLNTHQKHQNTNILLHEKLKGLDTMFCSRKEGRKATGIAKAGGLKK